MKDYFYDAISRCFGNAIYTVYGAVAVTLLRDEKDTLIKYVAYDLPHHTLMELDEKEKASHIKLEKMYDISDLDFSSELSVIKKIDKLVTDFEVAVYKG